MRRRSPKMKLFDYTLVIFLILAYPCFAQASDRINLHNDDELMLYITDMGYGDAALIQLPSQKKILIDCGTYESANRLLNFLREKNVERLDLLVLTHPHDNHYGGLETIAAALSIQEIITSNKHDVPPDLKQTYESLQAKNIPIHEVRRGKTLALDPDTQLDVLHPSHLTGEPNVDSLVLQIRFKKMILLFTGDIPPDVQTELIASKILTIHPDLVTLPHHGGKVSDLFAAFVANATKVISTGPHETWKAPDQETVNRFDRKLFRTDISGPLRFSIQSESITQIK